MARFMPFFVYESRKLQRSSPAPAVILTALCGFICSPAAAYAVDLSGNPYIKTPPYRPPPLPPLVASPSSGQAARGSKADMFRPYNPPKVEYRPAHNIDPGKAVNHDQWCRRNHPSYRPTDNTYRPFDKGGAMPPQARIPCISPYKS